MSQRQDPSDFLKQIIGMPVVVKLNSGVDYRGVLGSLDGYMNIVLEQTEEYVNGQLKNKYGDAFVRGNNAELEEIILENLCQSCVILLYDISSTFYVQFLETFYSKKTIYRKYIMASKDPKLRNIAIKSGVVKRLAKEKQMYEKEVVQHEEKIETMKKEQKDEYDIKKMIEVKNESAAMIPDCRRRLKAAHEELTALLGDETSVAESEEYKNAQTILKDAAGQIS